MSDNIHYIDSNLIHPSLRDRYINHVTVIPNQKDSQISKQSDNAGCGLALATAISGIAFCFVPDFLLIGVILFIFSPFLYFIIDHAINKENISNSYNSFATIETYLPQIATNDLEKSYIICFVSVCNAFNKKLLDNTSLLPQITLLYSESLDIDTHLHRINSVFNDASSRSIQAKLQENTIKIQVTTDPIQLRSLQQNHNALQSQIANS